MREQQRRLTDDTDDTADTDQPLSAEVPRTPQHPDLDPQRTTDVDVENLPNTGDVETPPAGEKPEPPD